MGTFKKIKSYSIKIEGIKELSKQATVEAIVKIHKGYNGSQLSLNSFELLNDRLRCG